MRVLLAHAAWDPPRAAAFEGRFCAIDDAFVGIGALGVELYRSSVPEHANVWATRLWRCIADGQNRSEDETCVLLNDDVDVHPDILQHVETLSRLLPGEILSLHGQFPALRAKGARLVQCFWPSGPAYTLTPKLARDLLSFIDLRPGLFRGSVNEDEIMSHWFFARGRGAICTIPALVRHDTSLPSTLGYDHHAMRKAAVDWEDVPPAWSEADTRDIPLIPVPWL